jgi:hypothetical protein
MGVSAPRVPVPGVYVCGGGSNWNAELNRAKKIAALNCQGVPLTREALRATLLA